MADDDTDSHPENKSDIPVLTLPTGGFASRIPPSLLQDKSKEEQDLYNDISKIAAFVDWAAPAIVELNSQVRTTNGRVKTLWALKEVITGYKGLAVSFFALIGALAGVVEVWNFASAHLPHAASVVEALPK